VTLVHAVDVLLDGTLLTLNRAVGVLRRRNVAVERFTVRPCGPPGEGGVSRMTFALSTDAATADRVVQQFHKIVGVRAVAITTEQDHTTEEQP
jgi:acetolactate synthase small subunit